MFLCIFCGHICAGAGVTVWHRFTDNSSQYWVSIIQQILGRKLVSRLHIYLLNCYLPPLIFFPVNTQVWIFFLYCKNCQFLEIWVLYTSTESYRPLHTVCIQFSEIFPPKMMKIWQIKATHSPTVLCPSLSHLVNWY